MERTKLSSKGQIVIPKAIRDANGWVEGDTFTIEEKGGGILLKPQTDAQFPHKSIDEVIGILKFSGGGKSIDEMNRGVEAEARRMWKSLEKPKA